MTVGEPITTCAHAMFPNYLTCNSLFDVVIGMHQVQCIRPFDVVISFDYSIPLYS